MALQLLRLLRDLVVVNDDDPVRWPYGFGDSLRDQSAGDEDAAERPVLTVRQVFDLAWVLDGAAVGINV
jgi:hypothetical protein